MQPQEAHVVLVAALSMATLHALIPSHWLAFTLVARSQGWPVRRALAVTAIAGGGHAITTTLLGFAVALLGKTASRAIPEAAEHVAVAVVLIGLGLYVLAPTFRNRGPGHHDHGPFCTHQPIEPDAESPATADAPPHSHARVISSKTTVATLIAGMTLSPCLDILPLYVAAATLSWPLILAVSAILAAVTVVLMVIFVWLSLAGLERLKLPWLERNEPTVAGLILVVLGVALLVARR
jgi:putative Mn2+ efflux pump MntP